MKGLTVFFGNCYIAVAVLGLAFVSSGCEGGSKESQMVVPPAPPSETSKDSMDYYKSQMKKQGAAKK